eukprot:1800854-Pyramimonas_sp.AAC.1
MRIQLLEALDFKSGLVKYAEGAIACGAIVEKAERDGEKRVYLKHLPLGFWARMVKCAGAPFVGDLERRDDSLAGVLAGSLVFIERRTSEAFTFRASKVARAGFPFS